MVEAGLTASMSAEMSTMDVWLPAKIWDGRPLRCLRCDRTRGLDGSEGPPRVCGRSGY
jgi:hypothetical protein